MRERGGEKEGEREGRGGEREGRGGEGRGEGREGRGEGGAMENEECIVYQVLICEARCYFTVEETVAV